MKFKEAKKILEKEGFYVEKATRPCAISESFIEYEDPTICEAMQVVNSAGYFVCMEMSCFDERKARLKKEFEEHANAPVSGKEQPKEKKGIIYPSTSPKADFYYKHVLNEGNPALKEAASQFNDALLDEQAKKIEELTEENEDWKSWHEMQNRQIALSNIAFRNEKNRLGKEISRLNKIIHKKNEELRLTKIREKNLAKLGLKYVGENEKLKKKLADKIVDKIDAQALKSAESALAYKEKVIAEKDEVIADLGNELAATKKELEEKTKLVEVVRKGSKEYCEYGIAAEKMIRKMAKVIVSDKPVSLKDFKEYRRLANGYRFNPQLFDFSEEEEKKLSLIRDDSVAAVTNQKNCSPFKDTHPTEDSPEEVELDEILELFVRL